MKAKIWYRVAAVLLVLFSCWAHDGIPSSGSEMGRGAGGGGDEGGAFSGAGIYEELLGFLYGVWIFCDRAAAIGGGVDVADGGIAGGCVGADGIGGVGAGGVFCGGEGVDVDVLFYGAVDFLRRAMERVRNDTAFFFDR